MVLLLLDGFFQMDHDIRGLDRNHQNAPRMTDCMGVDGGFNAPGLVHLGEVDHGEHFVAGREPEIFGGAAHSQAVARE